MTGAPAAPRLSGARLAATAGAALLAFAGNSLLCRAALGAGRTDPASFTAVRIVSGAALLLALVGRRVRGHGGRVGLVRAACLFAYAALFSWAYVRLPASVGALVLFGVVQLTMIGWAARTGNRPRGREAVGALVAAAGLVALTLPGATRPDAAGVLLMAGSGVAWGAYSLLGRSAGAPAAATAAAFLGAVPAAVVVAGVAAASGSLHADPTGVLLAAVSGAVASGLGYVLWYAALPALGATRGAVVQLAVPVVASLGGAALLGEEIPLRLALAGAVVLGGIALAVLPQARTTAPPAPVAGPPAPPQA